MLFLIEYFDTSSGILNFFLEVFPLKIRAIISRNSKIPSHRTESYTFVSFSDGYTNQSKHISVYSFCVCVERAFTQQTPHMASKGSKGIKRSSDESETADSYWTYGLTDGKGRKPAYEYFDTSKLFPNHIRTNLQTLKTSE